MGRGSEFLSAVFGLIPSELGEFQILGLITHMFVHAGLFHIVGNMLMLYAFGPALEHGFGRLTLLGFYGFFGLIGGIAHACADLGSAIPLVGASGAIAGLVGAYTVTYGPASKIKLMLVFLFRPYFFYVPAALFGIIWMLMQVANASQGGCGGGVAWWAHIGGFVAGAALAFVCKGEVGEIVAGSGETVKLMSAEEKAEEEARQEEIRDRKANGLSAIVIPLQEAELAPPPTVCDNCNAELLEENKIGDQLYSCSSCQRMTYLSVQQAEAFATAES